MASRLATGSFAFRVSPGFTRTERTVPGTGDSQTFAPGDGPVGTAAGARSAGGALAGVTGAGGAATGGGVAWAGSGSSPVCGTSPSRTSTSTSYALPFTVMRSFIREPFV